MCASKIVKRDNVGAILDRALDAGGGLLRLTPDLGAAQLPAPRQANQAGPDRLVRPGHASRAASTSAGSPAPPRPPTKAAPPTKG